jgi:hypothetical protein
MFQTVFINHRYCLAAIVRAILVGTFIPTNVALDFMSRTFMLFRFVSPAYLVELQ